MAAKTKGLKKKSGLFSKLKDLFSSKGKEKNLVSEYEEIVQRNPEDHRARIKLGEWYAKQGNLDRATEEFLTVAMAYKNDGFNLKAIATYKQILKINPSDTTIILELADLYKRQGLIRDAINQYHEAITIFQKEEKKADVLRILKKMSELSHDSPDLGLRLVDIYCAEGFSKEAAEQLLLVAALYNEREEKEEAVGVYKRLLDLYPDVLAGLQALKEFFEERGSTSKAALVKELYAEVNSRPALDDSLDQVAARLRTIDTSDSGFFVDQEAPEGAPEPEVGELDKEIESFIQSYSWKEEEPQVEMPTEPFSVIEDTVAPKEGDVEVGEVFRHRRDPGSVRSVETRSRSVEEPELLELEVPVLTEDALEGFEEIEELEELGEIEELGESDKHTDEAPLQAESQQRQGPIADSEDLLGSENRENQNAREGIQESTEADLPQNEDQDLDEYEPPEEEELVYRATDSTEDRVRLKSDRDFLEKGFGAKDVSNFDPSSHEAFTSAGFERVFEEFKKGLEKQIGEEDAETHYNLGIAYKEMVLVEEAIHEFEVALRSPEWRVDSLTMIGMCFEDMGDYEQSIEYFLEAIQSDGLSQDKVMGLNYEVGLALEALERYEEAYDYFSKVYALDENYRNVKKKLAELLKELKT